MTALSPHYLQIKQLRSKGDCGAAISLLRARPPAGDEDAFEAVICLFVCGELESALGICRTYAWKKEWAAHIAGALSESLSGGDASRALALARKAAALSAAPYDAAAIYLLFLQRSELIEEARAYIARRLQDTPVTETFLLTIMAEIAAAGGNWREAHRHASGVLSADPDDFRAHIVMSIVNYQIGNIHSALGHAMAAALLRRGAAPAVLQLMRCRNKLGSHYAALGAFETLGDPSAVTPELRVELGNAYRGLGDDERSIAEYRSALASDAPPLEALRALAGIHATRGDAAALEALTEAHRGEMNGDFVCLVWLGLEALRRADLDRASEIFKRTLALTADIDDPLRELPWPIPEPRVRHDCEQLALLARRGKLGAAGRDALALLERYCASESRPDATFAPAGAQAQALKNALTTAFYIPDPPFSGRALGANDYAAIEEEYLSSSLVVIDDFLSQEALENLRGFCEEATVWKLNYERGYLGALLGQGFNPRVLLEIAGELKKAMPRVIADHALMQAWAYKYDQRMQGINMHADFAEVNVNFWITPDEACEDPTTGGMVVYDLPVPASWTFHEYNNESEKLAVYLKVHHAKPRRVPYRANRCVLFDSRLIHITDEMRFRTGYENRRVNVTLLYGAGPRAV